MYSKKTKKGEKMTAELNSIMPHSISVAILIEDLNEVKKISSVFRQMGIIPHFYEDLKTFWDEILENRPSLAIVDVQKASEGKLLLGQHPLVVDEQMPLAFFYTSDTEFLLFTTFEIYNLGLISKTLSYKGQIKSILKRYNKFLQLQTKVEEEHSSISEKHEKQVSTVIEKLEDFKEKHFYAQKLKTICFAFEKQRASKCFDFFKVCENVFSDVEEISEFAFVELSKSTQKLISPDSRSKKYKKIPDLWLGKECSDGIESFAQNLVSQVGIDLIGGNLISLLVRGKKNHPEKMLLLGLKNEDFLNNFDWVLFENYLTAPFMFYDIGHENSNDSTSESVSSWEMMSILDQHFYNSKEGDEEQIGLVDINFSSLIEAIHDKLGIRFYWNRFYQEFIIKFKLANPDLNFQFSPMGLSNLAFIINRDLNEELFLRLKSFTGKYPFWRYFENEEQVLLHEISPVVSIVPLSGEAYLREINGESIFRKPHFFDGISDQM